MFYNAKDILDLFGILNTNKINYILTKNIDDELPANLKIGKDIDLIVHSQHYTKFKYLMRTYGYDVIIHPHGKEVGWKFIYGAHENVMFRHSLNSVEVDIYAELCTKSIAMNAWLPLDKIIQESIWTNKVWDDVNHWWIMDDENLVIYLLTRSIFEKKGFSEAYIREIKKRKRFLINSTAQQKLEKIFFKFTDTLIDKVNRGQYGDMFNSYVRFTDY